MYNNQKIGVGIATCNRKDSFKRLLDEIISTDYIDFIAVVKNKEFDYGDICTNNDKRYQFFSVKDDLGIGYCKNVLLKHFLQLGCDHIFIIEDDINIKNNNVYKEYIDTAKAFNLGHLNFNRAWNSQENKFLEPFTKVTANTKTIELFFKLCGDFQYFTANALNKVGLYDAENYINALEHAEHSYRLILANEYTPYCAFADIEKSDRYIEDTGIQSSIGYNSELFNKRVKHAVETFKNTYGYYLYQIKPKTITELQQFFNERFNTHE